jgi:hypothetical protein
VKAFACYKVVYFNEATIIRFSRVLYTASRTFVCVAAVGSKRRTPSVSGCAYAHTDGGDVENARWRRHVRVCASMRCCCIRPSHFTRRGVVCALTEPAGSGHPRSDGLVFVMEITHKTGAAQCIQIREGDSPERLAEVRAQHQHRGV